MSDGCKKLICVAMIIGALALFVFSVAGIKYLNRASPQMSSISDLVFKRQKHLSGSTSEEKRTMTAKKTTYTPKSMAFHAKTDCTID